MKHGHTVIVVAHRLATVKNADKIVVMHNGKIIGEGAHDSLMAIEDGVYKKLVMKQQLLEVK